MGFAFSQAITQRPIRSAFFYSSVIIAFIGLLQSVDRVRGTFLIATYLHRFVEPKLSNVKWEMRLKKFRDHSSSGHHRLMSINVSYVIIAWLNWVLGTAYIWRELQQNSDSHSVSMLWLMRATLALTFLGAIALSWFAKSQYSKYVTNYITAYDKIWEKVEEAEGNLPEEPNQPPPNKSSDCVKTRKPCELSTALLLLR